MDGEISACNDETDIWNLLAKHAIEIVTIRKNRNYNLAIALLVVIRMFGMFLFLLPYTPPCTWLNSNEVGY